MGHIKLDELSTSLKEYINTLGLTEEQVNTLIEQFSGDKSQLQTNAKDSLVAAINELFQSANNGKELIANAIGEPLNSSDTFSAMSNGINNLNSQFKSALMNNGVSIESSDKFKQLIEKLALLADSEGKGIQYASGTIDTSITSERTINTNLNFSPNIIFVTGCNMTFSHTNNKYTRTNTGLVLSNLNDTMILGSFTNTAINMTVNINNITQDSFIITPHFNNLKDYSLYLNSWYAIGVGEEDTTLEDTLRDILANKGVEVSAEDDLASLITKVENLYISPLPKWYNGKINKWIDSGTNMPTGRYGMAYGFINDNLYVIGGARTTVNEVYNVNSNTWITKTPISTAYNYLTSAVVDNKIYCFSGTDNKCYDPSNDTWSDKASKTVSLALSNASDTINGMVYCITKNSNECYDPITNTWSTKTAVSDDYSYTNSIAVNGLLYRIGGYKYANSSDYYYGLTKCYDPTTDTWSDKASYGTTNLKGCRESALCEYNNIIYVLGGYNGNTFANISAVPYVFAYNTITETWENAWGSSLANIPNNLYPKNSIAISYMGHIHLIGGRNENGSSTMNNNCVYLI